MKATGRDELEVPMLHWCHVDGREPLQWLSAEVGVARGTSLQHPQLLLRGREGF